MNNILVVLAEFGEIEWSYCNTENGLSKTYPESRSFPPVVVWRYKTPSAHIAEKLSRAVESFRGTIEWRLDTERTNWVLCPSRVHNRDDVMHLHDSEPEYGIRANAELRELAEHISVH